MFQAFKDDLLQEFEKERDIVVVSAKRRNRESLFGIRSDNDKIYTQILINFERIVMKKTRELVLELCAKHNIKAYEGQQMLHNIVLEQDNKRKHIVILGKTESVNSEQFAMVLNNVRFLNEPCTFVFLLKDTIENRRAITHIEARFYNDVSLYEDVPELFSCALFEDFLLNTFGEQEVEAFNHMLESFKADFHNILGYQITEICSPQNLSKLRNELHDELKSFSYENIRQKRFFESKSKSDISDANFQRIRRNFIDGNKYKLLIQDGDFAQSLLTSEWLYKKYVMLEQLDNTFIVAGYLKSVEQLLWSIIKLTGRGKFIKDKKIGTAKEDEIDTTLGSLEHFVSDDANSDLFIDAFNNNTFVIKYIKRQISSWRAKKRNGLFHKSQLKDKAKIDDIRQETIFLYFLILGSLNLTDDQVKKLEK